MADEERRDARALALVNAHAQRRASIMAALLRALLGLWGGFYQWDNRPLVYARAARSAVHVDTAMNKTRMLARSYSTAMLRELDAELKKPLPAIEDVYPRSGVTALEVYQRPVNQYLAELAKGVPEAEARKHALERFEELATTDIMLAERDETARVFEQSPKITGRRRVIHPELSKSGQSCGLCIVASANIYRVDELSPIHDGCNCTDMGITIDHDPGLRINEDDLKALYKLAGGNTAEKLKQVRVSITEHGELGMVLTAAEHQFRNVDAVNAMTSRKEFKKFERVTIDDQRVAWRAMADSAIRSIDILEQSRTDDVDAGKGIDEAIKYHRDLIARFEQKLR